MEYPKRSEKAYAKQQIFLIRLKKCCWGEMMFKALRPATMISPEERLDKVLKMMKTGVTTFIVADKGKYLGVVTDRTLRSIQGEPDKKIGNIISKVPVVRPEMELEQISECFLHGYRELPVCEDSKVLGTIKHVDLLKYLLDEGRIPSRRVSDIMSSPAITITEDRSITQAASLMRENNIHHLVVVDDLGRLEGIISTADIAPMLERDKERVPFVREKMGLSSIQLKSVVVPEVYTIKPSSTLAEAANMMIEKDASTLLVFDGNPVGMVHVYDIIKASLPTSEPRFEIIGLDPVDKEFRDDIRREVVKELQKISQIFPV
ncbi:MAG: CBS domain-containing protein, partial [Candidatus Micrarchaeia archaeon]